MNKFIFFILVFIISFSLVFAEEMLSGRVFDRRGVNIWWPLIEQVEDRLGIKYHGVGVLGEVQEINDLDLGRRRLNLLRDYFYSKTDLETLTKVNGFREGGYTDVFGKVRTELLKAINEGRINLSPDQKLLLIDDMYKKFPTLFNTKEMETSAWKYIGAPQPPGTRFEDIDRIERNNEFFIRKYISGELNTDTFTRFNIAKNSEEFLPYLKTDYHRDVINWWIAKDENGDFLYSLDDIANLAREKFKERYPDLNFARATINTIIVRTRKLFTEFLQGRFKDFASKLEMERAFMEELPDIFSGEWQKQAAILSRTEKLPGQTYNYSEILEIIKKDPGIADKPNLGQISKFLLTLNSRLEAYQNMIRDASKFVELLNIFKERNLISNSNYEFYISLVKPGSNGKFVNTGKLAEIIGQNREPFQSNMNRFFHSKKAEPVVMEVFGSLDNFEQARENVFGKSNAVFYRTNNPPESLKLVKELNDLKQERAKLEIQLGERLVGGSNLEKMGESIKPVRGVAQPLLPEEKISKGAVKEGGGKIKYPIAEFWAKLLEGIGRSARKVPEIPRLP